MPITYVRYVHRKPDPEPIPAAFEELEPDELVLLFDPIAEATTIPVGELYRRLDASLRANEIIIFRGADPGFLQTLEVDSILPRLMAEKKVLALVGETEKGRPTPRLCSVAKFAVPERQIHIESLREAELTAILRRTEAIFESEEFHFELPSGLHAEKFVRLGDAFRSIFDIRRTTDWILPYLTGNTVVVADTGSMLPLVMDLRDQARLRFGWHVEISTLDGYPQDAVVVSDAVTAICNRPFVVKSRDTDAEPTVLFLISVNSSGRLCRLFRALDIKGSRIVIVCETTKDPHKDVAPSDATLVTFPIDRWSPGDDGKCDQCNKGSKNELIRVHRETYELLPSIKREAVKLDIKTAESLSWFWKIAAETKAVQLHVNVAYVNEDGQDDYRHFSVFLKTPELAKHAGFRGHCIEQLQKTVQEPNVILIPRHGNSDMVARLCREAFPSSRIVIVPPGKFPAEIQDAIRGAARILVADDAIVTGFTLRNLRTELFRVTQLLGMDPEVNAFVMVSRPSNQEPRLSIQRKYRGRQVKNIIEGVQLFLPGARQCPWCDEHRLLSSYRHRLTDVPLQLAEQRIRKLEAPMEPQLLMVQTGAGADDPKTWGSFFGTLDQVTAFAAGVCAAQTIRLQLGTLGGGIRAKVFDLPHAIHAYYEGVFLASILRTLNAAHVRYPISDAAVQAELMGIDPNRACPGVIAELALAAIDSKIPSREFRKRLEPWKEKDPWIALLIEIIDIVKPS